MSSTWPGARRLQLIIVSPPTEALPQVLAMGSPAKRREAFSLWGVCFLAEKEPSDHTVILFRLTSGSETRYG